MGRGSFPRPVLLALGSASDAERPAGTTLLRNRAPESIAHYHKDHERALGARVRSGGLPVSESMVEHDVAEVSVYLYRFENLPAFADIEELRWKTLIGNDGEKIGTIESIERDEDTDRVEFLQIGRGGFLGFGAERFLVPVTALVRVDEKSVRIDRPMATLEGVPGYDFERVHDPDYCASIRAWWCAADESGGRSPETGEEDASRIDPSIANEESGVLSPEP